MTSASELFSGRRCRRHNDVRIDSFLADAIFSSSSPFSSHQHRSAIRRHSQHYSSLSNRCISDSRRIHRRRFDLQEHHPEESGSIVNSDNHRSIRARNNNNNNSNNNNRLPGSVLLARERLVERLGGVSISENRPSSTASTTTRRNDFSTLNVLETRRKNPLGLNEDEVKCLQLEAFSSESCSVSMECTICLEGFQDGDEIVCLVCTHMFHSCCLFPWVRVCGACPNCRKRVLVKK